MTNQEALTLLLSLAAMVNLFIVTYIGAYFVGRLIGKLIACAIGVDVEIDSGYGIRRTIKLSGFELWSLIQKMESANHHARAKALRDIEGEL